MVVLFFRGIFSVYPRNKKGHGNFFKKGTLSALSDQKGHIKSALSDKKNGHIIVEISLVIKAYFGM